jgi:transporter family protein
MNWFLIASLTAFLWGSSAVFAKIGTVKISPRRMLMTVGITISILYSIIWKFWGSPFPAGNYLFPILSEGSAAIGFIFYYKALEHAPVSLISPVTSSAIIISVLIGVLLFKNPITTIQILSISSIVIGIILIAIKDFRFIKGNWAIKAMGAMLCWGIWGGFSGIAVRIVRPININLFFAFIAIPIWSIYFLFTGRKEGNKSKRIIKFYSPLKKDYLFAIGSALISSAGSILFYIAVNISYVSLVIPVANLHPLVSIIYDIINRNYPKIHQWIGIIMILIGLFFIQK